MISTGWDLNRVLAPIDKDSFEQVYWERCPLLVSNRPADYFDELFSLDAADQILSRGDLWFPCMRIFVAGKEIPATEFTKTWSYGFEQFHNVIDSGKVFDLYRQGATINILGLERLWEPLMTLNMKLEQELGFPIHTTAFLTPPVAKNVPPHQDTVDFFILQISGSKRWRIWRNPEPLPLVSTASVDEREATYGHYCDLKDTDLVGEYDLKPGDTLYAPRGFVHDAVTTDSASLHVTIGVNVYRWFDVLSALTQRAIDKLGQRIEYRTSIPIRSVRSETTKNESIKQVFATMVNDFSCELDLQIGFQLVDRFLLEGRYPARIGQILDLERIHCLTPTDGLMVRPGITYSLTKQKDVVALKFQNKEILLPEYLYSSIDFMTSCLNFHINHIPGELSEQDKMTLVRRLVQEGFLTVMVTP